MKRFWVLIVNVCMPSLVMGVLSVHPENPRWFADESGQAIYLGGHQSFVDLQDNSFNKEFIRNHERLLNWDKYVEFLKENNFNYLRNWVIWSTGNGKGIEFFYTDDERVLRLQKKYVRKVLDTLNDLDNVFYEIANELYAPQWQYEMIEFIHHYEKTKPKQHLVLMSAGGRTRTGEWKQMGRDPVVNSPADCFAVAGSWQSRRFKKKDPPANRSGKPGIVDTDHVSPGSNDVGYIWSAFTRGYHFNLYDKPFENPSAEGPDWQRARHSVGKVVEYAEKLDLVNVTPRDNLASTRFCLAKPGYQYIVYQPGDGPITVSGLQAGTSHDYEIFNAEEGKVIVKGRITISSSSESFRGTSKGSVLYIRSVTRQKY